MKPKPSITPALVLLWNTEDANDEDDKANPHENLSPGTQEANERGIISVPTASVKVGEE